MSSNYEKPAHTAVGAELLQVELTIKHGLAFQG